MRRRIAIGLFVGLVAAPWSARGQSAGTPVQVSGSVNVNTKGISNVPALTLGRPAAIFDVAVRKDRWGFEPQFRFGLDGDPWSFLLWARYRAVSGSRFRLTLGAHPAFSFRRFTAAVGGVDRELLQVRRYVAGEATPTWTVTSRASAGAYYLYSRGIDFGTPRHTQLVAARATVSHPALMGRFAFQITPQVYHLLTNGESGVYVNASASIGLSNSPFSIGAIVNKPVESEVTGGQRFLWNVSVNYTFR